MHHLTNKGEGRRPEVQRMGNNFFLYQLFTKSLFKF